MWVMLNPVGEGGTGYVPTCFQPYPGAFAPRGRGNRTVKCSPLYWRPSRMPRGGLFIDMGYLQ
jgi:hypothetical protein